MSMVVDGGQAQVVIDQAPAVVGQAGALQGLPAGLHQWPVFVRQVYHYSEHGVGLLNSRFCGSLARIKLATLQYRVQQ